MTPDEPASAKPQHIAVIFNPTAGSRRGFKVARFADALSRRGLVPILQETTAPGHATELALTVEADVVVAAGGDGTINEVVQGLMRRPAPRPTLALLPLGTANVLANEVGLAGLTLDGLAQLVKDAKSEQICLGQVNGRYFVQMAGVGFDAHVVRGVDAKLKKRLGKLLYIWRSIVEVVVYKEQLYRVTFDGEERQAATVIIANGRHYAGRFVSAPDARIQDPQLRLCLFTRPGRLNAMRSALALLAGRLHRLPDVYIVPATHARIVSVSSADAEPIQADGDVVGCLPAEIAVSSERLCLIMPPAG